MPRSPKTSTPTRALGYHRDDITDVFLTHLHFDHCGGAIRRRPGDPEKFDPAFANAVFLEYRTPLALGE